VPFEGVEQRTRLGIEGGRPAQRRPCGEGVNDTGFGSAASSTRGCGVQPALNATR
jgi:hypothetical protein